MTPNLYYYASDSLDSVATEVHANSSLLQRDKLNWLAGDANPNSVSCNLCMTTDKLKHTGRSEKNHITQILRCKKVTARLFGLIGPVLLTPVMTVVGFTQIIGN